MQAGQTANAVLYCEKLDRVNRSLIGKCPAIVNRKVIILQYDNGRPHCARRPLEKLNESRWKVLPHRPYPPDIMSSDFDLFRSPQHFLSGKTCKNTDDVQIPIPDILLNNELIFIDPGLKILNTRGQNIFDNGSDYIID